MVELNQITVECRTYLEVAHTHQHAYAQLILPLTGALFIETAANSIPLNEDRLFFLPPDCRHTFYAKDNNQFLVLDVPAALIPDRPGFRPTGGLAPALDERWLAVRFLLLSEIDRTAPSAQAIVDLFRYAYRLLQPEISPRSLQYLQAHYHTPLNLQTLADLEGFNLTYYCEWFKKLTGLTPHAYLRRLRLDRAKELLAQTDLPILHIAQQVGYEHHASLTRLFQQQEGCTPQAYRRQSRI